MYGLQDMHGHETVRVERQILASDQKQLKHNKS